MDDLKDRQQWAEAHALAVNAGRAPKFGDLMRNPWASESNPQRDGYFVRAKRTTGKLNPGLWYEMTDKNGKFWEVNGKCQFFVDAPSSAPTAGSIEEDVHFQCTLYHYVAARAKLSAGEITKDDATDAFRALIAHIDTWAARQREQAYTDQMPRIRHLENERDLALKAARSAGDAVPAVKYGCHCDLEPHMEPDGCVLDEDRAEDCVYARRHKSKESCEYWQPIKFGAAPAPGNTADN